MMISTPGLIPFGIGGFLFMLRAIHYISIAKTRIDGIILN